MEVDRHEPDKIPAAEYARRHGWRKSAVIHRIRAGIYDGVREGNTWYVLRNRKLGVGENEEYPFDPEQPPRQLPWSTVEGPFRWVTWVVLAVVVSILCTLVFQGEEATLLVALSGVTIFSSVILYEGLRTGTIRNRGFDPTFSEHPILFALLATVYAMTALVSLGVLISELLN